MLGHDPFYCESAMPESFRVVVKIPKYPVACYRDRNFSPPEADKPLASERRSRVPYSGCQKKFRYSNVFYYNHLYRNSVFRNIIMQSGIKS